MKKPLLIILLLAINLFSFAQTPAKTASRSLKKVLTLLMPRKAEDEMPGTRGACVAWHPVQKKYYASMAGNYQYPMGVYYATGKRLSAPDASCQIDTRGLWYNTASGMIEGNTYAKAEPGGLFAYRLDAKGLLLQTMLYLNGTVIPADNAVGAYDATNHRIIYLVGNEVTSYDAADGKFISSTTIQWGHTKQQGPVDLSNEQLADDYNSTSVVYTGIKGAEWGLLNTNEKRLELYNEADGYLSRTWQFPTTAVLNSTFNLAYCNNILWSFDMDTRTWVGYQ
ncbi:MAG TPA: hypothetical protein PKK69_08085 [Ferruginibacter sp.]|nr:hypothetical protein [Ferruginibacter sp.]